MTLELPEIGFQNYNRILRETMARIPVHNPQWTNFNDSDPGVTLIQLFAFMTDSLLYRANLIPERNRIQFLNLLGVPIRPAAAAQGLVTFNNPSGELKPHLLDDELTVYAGNIPFRTLDGLDVLPIETAVFYKRPLTDDERENLEEQIYTEIYAGFLGSDNTLDYYETTPLTTPVSGAPYPVVDVGKTLDGSLWVALLARNAEEVSNARKVIENTTLTLGILPALTEAEKTLYPAGTEVAALSKLVYQIPKMPEGGRLPDDPTQRIAQYTTLPDTPSNDLLATPGVVELQLPKKEELILWPNIEPTEEGTGDFPPAIEDTETAARLITWLRIRLQESDVVDEKVRQLRGRISWVGVNTVRVTQRVRVFAENLGTGTGEPDQSKTVINTPVIPGSVVLTVNGKAWQEVDDLLAVPPEVPVSAPQTVPGAIPSPPSIDKAEVFKVDYESGTIQCGDGLHGKRWPRNAILRAVYDYGGGAQGNVGIGAITKGADLPSGIKVHNPIPTWGGDKAETPAEAEKRIPFYLQHRDRLVAHMDFKEILQQAPGVDIGRFDVLPLAHPEMDDIESPGVVTIVVVPAFDPLHPNAPEPDRLFLETVCTHLEPRRLITTELHVIGPEYVPIWLSAGIEVIPGEDTAPVREAVKKALRTFLSPLIGGYEKKGWPLGTAVTVLQLWATAARVPGVASVTGLLLCKGSEQAREEVRMSRLQLPEIKGISVQVGNPIPLAELRGDTPTSDLPDDSDTGDEPHPIAVPILETEC